MVLNRPVKLRKSKRHMWGNYINKKHSKKQCCRSGICEWCNSSIFRKRIKEQQETYMLMKEFQEGLR